jgi:predicted naringenin-chalcone synthase
MIRQPKPRIVDVHTVVPRYSFTQHFALELVKEWLSGSGSHSELSIAKTTQVFRNAGVETRYSIIPIEEILTERGFAERNALYAKHAKELGEEALRGVFESTRIKPSEIDLFISVSCTGFMIPSLDAHLLNRFPFRKDVRRIPITELGCAAGVASLMMASDFVRAYPDSKVLVLSVELCTLSFQPGDKSADHIISSAIFGDGAAAAIVAGEADSGLHILKTATRFFPETLHFMGFDVEPSGFHIFLSPQIPRFIQANLLAQIEPLTIESGFRLGDIDAWLFHPGGVRILEAIEKALGIDGEKLEESRSVLRNYGNLSSATIFFVLKRYLQERRKASGQHQFLGAVGAGFELDSILAEWK